MRLASRGKLLMDSGVGSPTSRHIHHHVDSKRASRKRRAGSRERHAFQSCRNPLHRRVSPHPRAVPAQCPCLRVSWRGAWGCRCQRESRWRRATAIARLLEEAHRGSWGPTSMAQGLTLWGLRGQSESPFWPACVDEQNPSRGARHRYVRRSKCRCIPV